MPYSALLYLSCRWQHFTPLHCLLCSSYCKSPSLLSFRWPLSLPHCTGIQASSSFERECIMFKDGNNSVWNRCTRPMRKPLKMVKNPASLGLAPAPRLLLSDFPVSFQDVTAISIGAFNSKRAPWNSWPFGLGIRPGELGEVSGPNLGSRCTRPGQGITSQSFSELGTRYWRTNGFCHMIGP